MVSTTMLGTRVIPVPRYAYTPTTPVTYTPPHATGVVVGAPAKDIHKELATHATGRNACKETPHHICTYCHATIILGNKCMAILFAMLTISVFIISHSAIMPFIISSLRRAPSEVSHDRCLD